MRPLLPIPAMTASPSAAAAPVRMPQIPLPAPPAGLPPLLPPDVIHHLTALSAATGLPPQQILSMPMSPPLSQIFSAAPQQIALPHVFSPAAALAAAGVAPDAMDAGAAQPAPFSLPPPPLPVSDSLPEGGPTPGYGGLSPLDVDTLSAADDKDSHSERWAHRPKAVRLPGR